MMTLIKMLNVNKASMVCLTLRKPATYLGSSVTRCALLPISRVACSRRLRRVSLSINPEYRAESSLTVSFIESRTVEYTLVCRSGSVVEETCDETFSVNEDICWVGLLIRL